MQPYIRSLCLAIFILLQVTVYAQFTARLDSNRLLIGEQTRLYLLATIPPGVDSFQLSSPLDTLPVTVLNETDWQRDGSNLKKEYLLSIYDSVFVRIPPFMIRYQLAADTQRLTSNDLALTGMYPALSDSLTLAPIKPIIEEPLTVEDIIPWLLGTLVLAALVIIFIWWRKRKKEDDEEVAFVPSRPAHEVAFEQLADLRKQKLWQKGQHKEYQSVLSYIFRQYLENRYRFNALEMTSGEIDLALGSRNIEQQKLEQALEILQKADLVKYAKAEPTVEWQQESIDMVEKWVRDTKYVPEPVETEKSEAAS